MENTEQFIEKVKKEVKEVVNGMASKESMQKGLEKIELEIKDSGFASEKKMADLAGNVSDIKKKIENITAAKQADTTGVHKFAKRVSDLYKSENVEDVIQGLKAEKYVLEVDTLKGFNFDDTTFTIGPNGATVGAIAAGARYDPIKGFVDVINQLTTPMPTTLTAIPVISETNGAGDNPAAPVAYGALKPESVGELDVVFNPMKTIAVWDDVPEQMLASQSSVLTWVMERLMRKVSDVVQVQIISGDGTGNNLTGLATYAQPFVRQADIWPAGFANNFSVMRNARTQVGVANYLADFHLQNTISQLVSLEGTRVGATNEYNIPDVSIGSKPSIVGFDGQSLDKVPIIETNAITFDNGITGSRRATTLFNTGGIKITMSNPEYKSNLVTVRGEISMALVAGLNEQNALVNYDFSDAITALELP